VTHGCPNVPLLTWHIEDAINDSVKRLPFSSINLKTEFRGSWKALLDQNSKAGTDKENQQTSQYSNEMGQQAIKYNIASLDILQPALSRWKRGRFLLFVKGTFDSGLLLASDKSDKKCPIQLQSLAQSTLPLPVQLWDNTEDALLPLKFTDDRKRNSVLTALCWHPTSMVFAVGDQTGNVLGYDAQTFKESVVRGLDRDTRNEQFQKFGQKSNLRWYRHRPAFHLKQNEQQAISCIEFNDDGRY
jgi:hypothetical protein